MNLVIWTFLTVVVTVVCTRSAKVVLRFINAMFDKLENYIDDKKQNKYRF